MTATISESRWRRYLNAHGKVTRKLESLRRAGGDANDLGRVLHRIQRHRLYLAQFPTFNECVLQEWQMPAGLADALITMGRALSKEEAQAAGVVPLPVLRELREMLPPEAQGPFDEFQKDLTIGKGAQERVLRAGKEVQAAGHGTKNAQAVVDRLLMEAEMQRKERAAEREQQGTVLGRKPFQAVPWVVEPAPGAEGQEVQAAALVRDAMRRAAPQMKQGLDRLREVQRVVSGAAFTFTGPEPQRFMENLFGLYGQLPGFLAEMSQHLPVEEQEKWRERLRGCPGVMETGAAGEAKADDKPVAEPVVEPVAEPVVDGGVAPDAQVPPPQPPVDAPIAASPDKIRDCGRVWPGALLLLVMLGLCVPRLISQDRFAMRGERAENSHDERQRPLFRSHGEDKAFVPAPPAHAAVRAEAEAAPRARRGPRDGNVLGEHGRTAASSHVLAGRHKQGRVRVVQRGPPHGLTRRRKNGL